ncbi:hypothetical protein [Acidocella sp. MX-AZ03]|uniref:hypothetical protein n=1 Tax=Acidocella sp. MX-AZ03 TaxID=2697363 RepID=UPI002FD82693
MADREIQTLGAVARPLPHDSAAAQISGTALYADDVPEAANILHGAFGLSSVAHARLTGLDLSAVQSAPGVVAVFSAINIPGKNDVSPSPGMTGSSRKMRWSITARRCSWWSPAPIRRRGGRRNWARPRMSRCRPCSPLPKRWRRTA